MLSRLKRKPIVTLLALWTVAVFALLGARPAAAAFDTIAYVYVSGAGNDRNKGDGRSPDQAVATLARGVEIAKFRFAGGADAVVVNIRPGTYFVGGSGPVRIDGKFAAAVPDAATKLLVLQTDRLADDPFARAVFDGRTSARDALGKACSFLTVRVEDAAAIPRVMIRGLAFENLRSPLNIIGDFHRPEVGGGHQIVGNVFRNIGDKYSCGDKFDYSALGLSSTRNNLVIANRFENIENKPPREPGLHPVYMSYDADNNRIEGNSFVNFSGAAVKIRDNSDGNVVQKNLFSTRIDKALKRNPALSVQAVYYSQNDNPDRAPECPSRDNDVADNVMLYDPMPALKGGREYGVHNAGRGDKRVPSKCQEPDRREDAQISARNNRTLGLGAKAPNLVQTFLSDYGYALDERQLAGTAPAYPYFGFCDAADACVGPNGQCVAPGQSVTAAGASYVCRANNLYRK